VTGIHDPELVVRFWKPHGVLCAFTDRDNRETLADYIEISDIYAAGRLDRDSEGLLLLTRSAKLRGMLMDPTIGHPRKYLVQVEGIPDRTAIDRIIAGIQLKDGWTRPAKAEVLHTPPVLPPRPAPIRVRKTVPDSWIRIELTEGRNRQVRRMTAAVGHPTLRLVREAIGPVTMRDLAPGESQPMASEAVTRLWSSLTKARATSRQARGPRPPRRR